MDGEITPIALADAHRAEISASYVDIDRKYGWKRNKVALGKNCICILTALKSLSGMKPRGGFNFLTKIAKSCIVVMQMISECARFESMLAFVKSVFRADRAPLQELVDKQNDWDTICQEIHGTTTSNLTARQRDVKLIKAKK